MSGKVINLKQQVSVDECKRILNKCGREYTLEEVETIRNFLIAMVDILIGLQKRQGLTIGKVIPINSDENETKESHTIYPGKHRRAS